MQSMYTCVITYLTWTQTGRFGPIEECLQGCRELSHNSGKHKSSQMIELYLTKHGTILYYTCNIGNKCMHARFTTCVYRPSCLKPQHSDGKRGLWLLAKPRFTDFSIEPRLSSAHDGTKPQLKRGPTAWGVWDKLGFSAAQRSGAAVSRTGGSRIYIYTGLAL